MKAVVCCALLALLLAGCSTRSNIYRTGDTVHLPGDAKFAVVDAVDASGYTFSDPAERFSLSEALSGSLTAALAMEGLSASSPGYIIRAKVTGYAPGNAFTRWLIPGAGATKLSTECVVLTADNVEVARIPVERVIAAGGGYTINAWKSVFDEVAKETVAVIRSQLLVPRLTLPKG